MMVFLLWIACTIGVAVWAERWNRSSFAWFGISFIFSPLIGAVCLLIAGLEGKTCPKCAEVIKIEAAKCKNCGTEFSNQNISNPPQSLCNEDGYKFAKIARAMEQQENEKMNIKRGLLGEEIK